MPPVATESAKGIFRTKVKVKVLRAVALVSFERASLDKLNMHAKYEASISYGSKVIANVKVDKRQTNKKNRQDKNQRPKGLFSLTW